MSAFVQGIRLRNFKRFESFYLSARPNNVLVGPNNSGKSSILDALRICNACLRYARTRPPTPMDVRDAGIVLGYQLPESSLPVPIANVTTNYNEDDAIIEIRCSNKSALIVRLHPSSSIRFYVTSQQHDLSTSKLFRAAVPLDFVIVPPLGPLDETEFIVLLETVRRNESSRIANRHFRNIWLYKTQKEWAEFRDLVVSSWPGVDVRPPNDVDTIILQSGGFGQWRRVKEVAWTLREIFKLNVDVFALFDRDYRSQEEVDRFLAQMQASSIKAFVLERKEIENYALTRANVIKVVRSRQEARLPQAKWLSERQIERLVDATSNRFKGDTFSQMVGHKIKFHQSLRDGTDPSTVTRTVNRVLDEAWADVDRRLTLLSGKEFIAELSIVLQKRKGFSITPAYAYRCSVQGGNCRRSGERNS